MHRPGPTSPADWHGDGRRSALVPRDSGTGLGRTRRSRRTRGLKDAAGQSFQGHKFTQMFQSILRCPGTIQIQFDPQIAGAAQRTRTPPPVHVPLVVIEPSLCDYTNNRAPREYRTVQWSMAARIGIRNRKQDAAWTGAGWWRTGTQRTRRASH